MPRHLALSFLLATAACGSPAGEETPPNVLLIVVDTLRSDHLGCYGYERDTSPNIDRLAAESVRYAHAWSQAPWTTPSIGSLLTSRYPSEIGIKSMHAILDDELTLLPEVLQRGGYRTGAVISHSFCSARWNFDQGFESFDESNIQGHQAVTSPEVTDRALEFLDRQGEAPWFLWVHYFDPHFAFLNHPEFEFGSGEGYDGPVSPGMKFSKLAGMRKELEPEDVEQIVRFYDSEIAFTDHQIGRLLDGARELGLFDDMLICFTADHGEEFLDHKKLGHAKTLYRELLGVPLIVKYPAGRQAVVEEPVALLDVFPTVLDVTGIESAEELQGSVLPRGPRDQRDPGDPHDPGERRVFSETARLGGIRAVTGSRYRLIEHAKRGRLELFDTVTDPLEQRNLAASPPAGFEELRTALARWGREMEENGREERLLDLTPEELEHLGALGYTGGDE